MVFMTRPYTAGVHLTGMYIHPAMATGHTWGCGDTDRATHILIYWIGPMVGTWISVQVWGAHFTVGFIMDLFVILCIMLYISMQLKELS